LLLLREIPADIDELTPSKNSAASIAGVGGIMTATSGAATPGRRSAKARVLMLKRVFGFAAATALPRRGEEISEMAFARRSTVLFQFLDSRAARKPASKKIAK